jgi:hypothetical protein
MNAATITALCTGITGVIGAVTALVALFVHAKNHPGS